MIDRGPDDVIPAVPAAPCEDCENRVMCGVERLACSQFLYFSRGFGPKGYGTLSKEPNEATYKKVFKDE